MKTFYSFFLDQRIMPVALDIMQSRELLFLSAALRGQNRSNQVFSITAVYLFFSKLAIYCIPKKGDQHSKTLFERSKFY